MVTFLFHLRGCQQFVRIDENAYRLCYLNSWFLEDGILSPFLLSLFMNLLIDNLQSARNLYAYDLQISSQAIFRKLLITPVAMARVTSLEPFLRMHKTNAIREIFEGAIPA